MHNFNSNFMQKLPYQMNSPYIELLQSKKKVYGHKYDPKTLKANWRASPGSTSLFSQGKRPFKTQSSQKARVNRSQNQKKRRTHTETAEEKLHESLYVQMGMEEHHHTHHATKSLFYGDSAENNHDKDLQVITKWPNAFEKSPKKYEKNKKYSHQESKGGSELVSSALESLRITDIDSLISLIDNCVAEANQYIAYLSQKIQEMKNQLSISNAAQNDLIKELKHRVELNAKKDQLIVAIEHEMEELKNRPVQPSDQIKKLLEVIEKLNGENQKLRKYVNSNSGILEGFKNYRESRDDKEKDTETNHEINHRKNSQNLYKEIYNKIDIFNISIDNKKKGNEYSPGKGKSDQKKHKYIKQKNPSK